MFKLSNAVNRLDWGGSFKSGKLLCAGGGEPAGKG
jgi:hypothetical protein